MERAFARIRIGGERFEGGRLPVDALQQIQRYQAFVLAAAKEDWLAKNPSKEVPEDFESAFDLSISAIEPGSAQVLLERPKADAYEPNYEEGRDELIRELESLFNQDVAVDQAPLFDLSNLHNFDAGLEPGDYVEFTSFSSAPGAQSPVVTYTAEQVAEVIPLRIEQLTPLEPPTVVVDKRPSELTSVAGRLVAIDAEQRSFRISTIHFGDLKGFYKSKDITDDLRAVVSSISKAPVVRVKGLLQFQGQDPWRIWNASEVELLEIDGQPWSRKVVELASLTRDWDGEAPGAEMISFVALEAARDLMLSFSEKQAVEPGMFPMEDGGVMLEWSSPEVVATIEISPDAEYLLFLLPDGSSGATEERTNDIKRAVQFGLEVAH